jgi:hypothetical protein
LSASTAHFRRLSDAETFPVAYSSTILQLFLESIGPWKDVQILDAGPVCQENLVYFAQKIQRFYACDLFIRLHRSLEQGGKSANFCQDLDYPPNSFDGIQLWDLVDHLDDDQARHLLARCFEMLRPAGLLMLIALEKKPEPATINSFVVGRNNRLDLRPQPHLVLPWYGRHNRALMSLLEEFEYVKTFRYRNGLRELLFQRPLTARN